MRAQVTRRVKSALERQFMSSMSDKLGWGFRRWKDGFHESRKTDVELSLQEQVASLREQHEASLKALQSEHTELVHQQTKLLVKRALERQFMSTARDQMVYAFSTWKDMMHMSRKSDVEKALRDQALEHDALVMRLKYDISKLRDELDKFKVYEDVISIQPPECLVTKVTKDDDILIKNGKSVEQFHIDDQIVDIEVNENSFKEFAATFIAACIRGFLARKKYQTFLRKIPHVILVKVHGAKDIMKISEIFVPSPSKRRPSVVAGFVSNFGTGVPDAYVLLNTIPLAVQSTDHSKSIACYSTAKTSVIKGTFNPDWDEDVRLTMIGPGYITLNLFSQSVIAEDIFLGQAIIDLQEHEKNLYKGKVVHLNMPVKFSSQKVFDTSGNEIEVPDVNAHGYISISVNILSVFSNFCGRFFQLQTNFIGAIYAEKVWIVLCQNVLYVYDTQYEGIFLRKIDGEEIDSVIEVDINKLEIVVPGLHLKLISGELIELLWGDDSITLKGLWKHALTFSTKAQYVQTLPRAGAKRKGTFVALDPDPITSAHSEILSFDISDDFEEDTSLASRLTLQPSLPPSSVDSEKAVDDDANKEGSNVSRDPKDVFSSKASETSKESISESAEVMESESKATNTPFHKVCTHCASVENVGACFQSSFDVTESSHINSINSDTQNRLAATIVDLVETRSIAQRAEQTISRLNKKLSFAEDELADIKSAYAEGNRYIKKLETDIEMVCYIFFMIYS
jgi:hypothetical protein